MGFMVCYQAVELCMDCVPYSGVHVCYQALELCMD